MGCGASSSALTEEQLNEMGTTECRDCIIICAQKMVDMAIDQKTLKVNVPTEEMAELKKSSELLRTQADEMKDSLGDAADKAGQAISGALSGFGKLGKMAGDAASKVTGAVGSATGTISKATLTGLAAALEAPIKQLDAAFNAVALEVVTKKRAEIVAAYNSIVKNATFGAPMKSIRGDADDYVSCPQDRITSEFMAASESSVKDELRKAVLDEVKASRAVNAWKEAVEAMNHASQQINGQDQQACKLDICEYIVDEINAQLKKEMATHEAAVRKAPGDVGATRPLSFAKVFSNAKLTAPDYALWKEGK
eukprot:TRINITY_DN39785_c0_g1_i1.p1 TRINITY_DN39785_c0_g1~~TRINITY_DN39785_c0_g1_i1.p1  ORF type:complete len:309 (-),score=105.66 TRINITY_DN39785_c0_g1_i1:78-1004(-)